jgi:hypothetical protein
VVPATTQGVPEETLMVPTTVWIRARVAIAVFILAASAHGSGVTGSILADGCTFRPSHVAVVYSEEGSMVLFTDRGLDVGLAYAFDPHQAALEELTGGELRSPMGLLLTLSKEGPSYFYFCADAETGATTQISGSDRNATLEIAVDSDTTLAGRWALTRTTDPSGSSRSWDLGFEAPRIDPARAARDLPRGGGEPGRAYLSYLKNLAAGDIDALRSFIDNPYYLAKDATRAELDSDLVDMRASQPASAVVVGGRVDATAAILEIAALLPDGSRNRQRILLTRVDDRWTFGGAKAVE